MDKTLLKNFATYSRNKLIDDVKNQAQLLGITDKGIEAPLSKTSDMAGFDIGTSEPYQIYGKQVKQYERLTEELKTREKNSDYATAYSSLVEEVAYTWFNRIIAIRFMEVNNYLPDRMRVLSSGIKGVDEPEFITDYDHTSLDLSDQEKEEIVQLKLEGSARSMDQIFQSLFIKECNRLNDYLPELFEKIDDYMEILLTLSYIDEDGVIYKLIHDIPEKYFDVESENGYGQVELIGWLYQYYNSERKDEVIDIIKKGSIKKEDIPAATQLFTTDWVVRYMVDNSLGKYWLERNPDSPIKNSLEYLMPGQLDLVEESISPQDIKVMDNAMGSGHCLVYAFELLMEIYESLGYTQRDAAKLILENNLYGLDIDKRAYQFSYFALMMKARQYNRRIFTENIQLNLGVFEDSTSINKEHLEYLGQTMDKSKRKQALEEILYLIDEFTNARELGSIIKLDDIDKDLLEELINDGDNFGQLSIDNINLAQTLESLKKLVKIASMLNKKYEILVTNPPYLNKFGPKLKKYVWDNYPDVKSDLFSVFIYRNIEMTKPNGYSAYMSPNVWMFIKSYEKLREYLLKQKHIDSLIQIAKGSFYSEATVDVMTFVIKNEISKKAGKFIRLEDFKKDMESQRIKTLEAIKNPSYSYYYETNQDNFEKIPGMPVAYWASAGIINSFEKGKPMGNIIEPRQGLATANNDRFLRLWYEVENCRINYNSASIKDSIDSKAKWFPYNKGGPRRQWYGNYDYLVNWENDGMEIRNFKDNKGKPRSRPQNTGYYFKESITWSDVTSGQFSIRYRNCGSIHDITGMSAFGENHNRLMYILGLLSTKISDYIFNIINPTLHLQIGNFSTFPLLEIEKLEAFNLVQKNISISRIDWDTFETSWDFKVSPLANFPVYMESYYDSLDEIGIITEKETFYIPNIETAYEHYKNFTNKQFEKLKTNEEELNRIFIEIYGLEDELDPYVSDRDVTIAKIFDSKNDIDEEIKGNRYILTKENVVKQFISYGVGCIMGRYSLDNPGLAYAGGDWNDSKYKSFKPVEDNIVLITDKPYFDDELTSRFINFVEVAYGKDSLEENLDFIASALGGRGDSREVIRKYFLDKFFADHVKTYKKRPIYWLYDGGAGKSNRQNQNSFKALVYMHRYNEDTTGKVRIDYLHEVQRTYERRLENLNYEIANSDNSRQIAQAEKEIERINKQLKEIKDYDEKIGHLALSRIGIDLDDGVKINYQKVQTDEKGKKMKILAKI